VRVGIGVELLLLGLHRSGSPELRRDRIGLRLNDFPGDELPVQGDALRPVHVRDMAELVRDQEQAANFRQRTERHVHHDHMAMHGLGHRADGHDTQLCLGGACGKRLQALEAFMQGGRGGVGGRHLGKLCQPHLLRALQHLRDVFAPGRAAAECQPEPQPSVQLHGVSLRKQL
jgi:hypothetical protein